MDWIGFHEHEGGFSRSFSHRGRVFESRAPLFCAGNEEFEVPSDDMHEVFGFDVDEGETRTKAR